MFKIATLADWFGLGVVEGIKASQRVGAEGVQLYAWNELNPYNITKETIAAVRGTAQACNQTITALCGELSEILPGGHGLEVAAENPPKVDYLKKVCELAAKLGCPVVTTHIGVIPESEEDPRYQALHNACSEIGLYAAQFGVRIAVETGPEPVPRLCKFVDGCSGGHVGINYDPANLVMVTDVDEVEGVYTAAHRIVHTHAKDGILKKYMGPEKAYAIFAEGGIEALAAIPDYFAELPLGEGSVRWPQYLKALADVGYDGYLTIEREVSKDAASDILLAAHFLKQQIHQLERGLNK